MEHVNVSQLEEYIKQDQFAPGSMLPKVEAAIAFVNGRPEGKAVITSLENLGALIESESGTIIEKRISCFTNKMYSISSIFISN